MRIHFKLTTSLLIFCFIMLWACKHSSNQNKEIKIVTDNKVEKQIKKAITVINFDSLKSKFKYRDLVSFNINYEITKELKRVDSLNYMKLQLNELFGDFQFFKNEEYCEHCVYYYSFQKESKNYYSIVVLAEGFEYANLLFWINYSKNGKLLAKTVIALFRIEGGIEDIQISKLSDDGEIYKISTQKSLTSGDIFNKTEEMSVLKASGTIKDTLIKQSEIQ